MHRPILLASALLALLAPAASAGWSAPQRLQSDGFSDEPQLSVAPDGTIHAVWDGPLDGATVWVADAAPGTTAFGPRREAVSVDREDSFVAPTVAADGRVTIVYERVHPPYTRARARVQQRDGSFGPAVTLSGRGHTARVPDAATNAAGDVWAAWRWYDGHEWIVQVGRKPRWRDGFLPADTLASSANAERFQPVLGVDELGRAVVAWESHGSVWAATGTMEDGLGAPQRLGTAATGASISAAMGAGRALVFWSAERFGHDDDASTFYAATAEPGSPFGAAQQVAGPFADIRDDGPAAAVTSDGTALAAYGRGAGIRVYTAPTAAPFGAPETIRPAAGPPEQPLLVTGPDGDALLAWDAERPERKGDEHLRTTIGAALRPAGAAAFSPPEDISEPALEGLYPTAALGPAGRAVVGWVQSPEGFGDGNPEVAVRTG